MDELARCFLQLKPTATTPLTSHHPEAHPSAPTCSYTETALLKKEPVDLAAIRQQIQENIDYWNWRFPPPTLKTPTAPPTRQPNTPIPSPTRFPVTEPEPPMTLQMTTQSDGEQLNRPPVPIATSTLSTVSLVSTDSTRPLSHPVATPAPMRSRIERMISQLDDSTTALWMPNALHQSIYANQSNGPDTIPACPPELDNRTHSLTASPKYTNNSRPDTPATSFFNPAFDIHLTWFDHRTQCYQHSDFDISHMLTDHRQQHHQHHSLLANYDTQPYNPAFDLHPTRPGPCTKTQQHHPCFSVATYVPGLAQNKRPP